MSETSGLYGYQQDGAAIGLDDDISRESENQYWRRVKWTLAEIFHVDKRLADQARARLHELRESGNANSARVIFYHASPLEVAADLAGRKTYEITAEERQRYFEKLGGREIPQLEDLRPIPLR
jgi:hypothetical protein